MERLTIDGLDLAASVRGDRARPALLLLHGWPHCRCLFDPVLDQFGETYFTLAFDLPGIGDSTGVPRSAEKTVLADLLLRAAEQLGAQRITVAGIDVGGMIAWSAARDHASRIGSAVIMNTVIPGIDPWQKLISNPHIWHFAFHAIPDLPERLVRDREHAYFDYFIDLLAGDATKISPALRQSFVTAYRRPEALKAGFDWYRAFDADAAHTSEHKPVATPILCLRGDADGRTVDAYAEGLRGKGATNVRGEMIRGCGEFLPQEAPAALVRAIRAFIDELTDDTR
jgi:pimeloyl-ACP methyl ester carboxylesterase